MVGNTDYYRNSDGERGYCGYAQSRSIVIKTARHPHPTAECDLIFRYKVSSPKWASFLFIGCLQKSVLDLGSSGLSLVSAPSGRTGRRIWRWIFPSEEMSMTFPGIPACLVSDYRTNYDSDGNVSGYSRTLGRSCKTGYEGIAYCILDFAVENGFKFQ